jgi:hypothetical protein
MGSAVPLLPFRAFNGILRVDLKLKLTSLKNARTLWESNNFALLVGVL